MNEKICSSAWSSQKSSSSLTPTIDHYNRLKGLHSNGGAIPSNIKSNISKARISEESDALRVAKKRDLREMINWLKFDHEFYQMANNCEQALNECEKVLLVRERDRVVWCLITWIVINYVIPIFCVYVMYSSGSN